MELFSAVSKRSRTVREMILTRSLVYDTLAAFEEDGWLTLVDQRCNGALKGRNA
jgi:hypothetical protein